jgi:serine/threonine protein kinase
MSKPTKASSSKQRLLFLSPSVMSGAEPEAQVSDFESLNRKALGEGAFGEVYKVRHKESGNLFAIKVISKEKVQASNMLQQIRREIRIMYALNHPHIVKLYNHFEDDKNFYLVLELAAGGTLWHRLAKFKNFDEDAAAQYLRELILAVEYLHSRDPPIIHRDIKPENLLLDKEGREGRIKVADFGWSNFFNDDRSRQTYCGTLDYLAPEMISQQGHGTNLDIWNLGVLLYELLAGEAPFKAANQQAMFEKIMKVKIEYPKNFPPLAKDLVQRLLKANPDERISLADIMRHPWMTTHQPTRQTITQSLHREPLPCGLEPTADEPPLDDPIKPFDESEYRLLSTPVADNRSESTSLEETKSSALPEVIQPKSPAAVSVDNRRSRSAAGTFSDTLSILETDLKQSRTENSSAKTQLELKEAELQAVNRKIKELELRLHDLEVEYTDKRQNEERLRDQLREKNQELIKYSSLQEDENRLYAELEGLKAQFLEKNTALNLLKAEVENIELLNKEKVSQITELETEVSRLKDEIEQSKQKLSKSKSELNDRMFQLNTEVELLQQELQTKTRDNGVGTLESLLKFVQENLEKLMGRSMKESELVKQYTSSHDRLFTVELQYTEMKLKYDADLAALKRKMETDLTETEARAKRLLEDVEDLKDPDIDNLKQRLAESKAAHEANKAAAEEMRLLQEHAERYEKSVKFYRRQVNDLEFLCTKDEEALRGQRIKLENYQMEIEKYRKQMMTK